MKALLKQHRQIKSQIRKSKKAIRNAQDTRKKCCVQLEQIGREASRYYVLHKDEKKRTVYMTKTEIEVKKLQKTLTKAEKVIKTETPAREALETELQKLLFKIKQVELEETEVTKTISLICKPQEINYISKKNRKQVHEN